MATARAKLASSFLAFGSNGDGATNSTSATKHVSISATESTLAFDGKSNADVALTGLSTASFSGLVTASTTPTADGHLANKAYVDGVAQGLDVKPSCHCATTAALPDINSQSWSYNSANKTLTAGAAGVHPAIDGITLAANDIVLIKDGFASAVQNGTGTSSNGCNGIYQVTILGTNAAQHVYTRIAEMDAANEFPHAFTFVEAGTVNANAGFVCTVRSPPNFSLDGNTAASNVTFTQFSGAGSIVAGDGLTKSGNTLSVVVDSTTIEINSDTLRVPTGGINTSQIADDAVTKVKLGADCAGAGLAQETDGSLKVVNATNGGISVSADDIKMDISNLSAITDNSGIPANADSIGVSDATDGNTTKKCTVGNLSKAVFANITGGDALVAANGALTIQPNAVEHGMLNDNVISGQDELAKTDIVDADELMISDGGTLKRVGVDSLQNHFFGNVEGDATIADGGTLTIANDAIEHGMLNDNIISGQNELAKNDIVDADELMISDGGTLKRVGVDSLQNHFFGNVSGNATIADGGALTIGSGLTVSNQAGTLAFTNTGVTLSVSTTSLIDQDLQKGGSVEFLDVVTGSDAKWKDNIKQCKGGLDMINKMRGVSWVWNDKVAQAGKQASGIIAQELAPVMPYALHNAEDGLKVNYNCLWGPAIEAIKELTAKVKDLEQRLEEHQHKE